MKIPQWKLVCDVQNSIVKYISLQYGTVRYGTVRYGTVRYGTVRYSTVQYSTVQYSTVQYSTLAWYIRCSTIIYYGSCPLKYKSNVNINNSKVYTTSIKICTEHIMGWMKTEIWTASCDWANTWRRPASPKKREHFRLGWCLFRGKYQQLFVPTWGKFFFIFTLKRVKNYFRSTGAKGFRQCVFGSKIEKADTFSNDMIALQLLHNIVR